jgi:hypothetical protein
LPIIIPTINTTYIGYPDKTVAMYTCSYLPNFVKQHPRKKNKSDFSELIDIALAKSANANL